MLLEPEQFDGFYLCSVFSYFSVIDWCQMNMNIPASKVYALEMGLKTQNIIFQKNGSALGAQT
jgi:hypothetical protein